MLRGRARGQEERFKDAVDDLDRAIDRDPKLTEAYLFRGSALRQLGQLDRAAADLDAVLAVDPQQPEALLERGIVRRLKGQDALRRGRLADPDRCRPEDPRRGRSAAQPREDGQEGRLRR